MRKIYLLILFLSIILIGCSNSIDSNKAEEIAIQTAIEEGYSNPKLFQSMIIRHEKNIIIQKTRTKI